MEAFMAVGRTWLLRADLGGLQTYEKLRNALQGREHLGVRKQ
jgi:hypothetical protein